eukprot:13590853-Alexandrium_andersonii.AAC.1
MAPLFLSRARRTPAKHLCWNHSLHAIPTPFRVEGFGKDIPATVGEGSGRPRVHTREGQTSGAG